MKRSFRTIVSRNGSRHLSDSTWIIYHSNFTLPDTLPRSLFLNWKKKLKFSPYPRFSKLLQKFIAEIYSDTFILYFKSLGLNM